MEDKQLLLLIDTIIHSSWYDFFCDEVFISGAVYCFPDTSPSHITIHSSFFHKSSSTAGCCVPHCWSVSTARLGHVHLLCSVLHVFHLISSGCWLNQAVSNQHHCSRSHTSADRHVLCTCRLMELVQSCPPTLCSCFRCVKHKWLPQTPVQRLWDGEWQESIE